MHQLAEAAAAAAVAAALEADILHSWPILATGDS